MELQALLVLGGVAVAGIAVLLLMGLFSNSGTSYEEAIAQQRRATTELLALAENKNKPKKSNKKAIKKLAKKEKSKENAAVTASEADSEAPAESGAEDDPIPAAKTHVDFSPPVVVDVPRDTTPNVKIRKRGKDPKVKPILINKEDPSCVSDPSTLPADNTVTNHFEEMHPKDDFELLHSTLIAEKAPEKKEEVVEKKETRVSKSAKNVKGTAKTTAPVEVVKEEVSRERHNGGDAPKEQRKSKKVEKKAINEDVVVEALREVVQPLNVPQPTELMTEKLLKQALAATAASAPIPVSVPAPAASTPPPTKNKKKKNEPNVLTLMAGDSGGVNVGELVRVVREAALSRTEIQILTDALLNKHHDPLPEHSEWTEGPNDPMQKLKKQLADKEKALADEIDASQALHAKLKELRASLNGERTKSAAARSAEVALLARLQRLIDENHALAQDKLVLQSKLGAEGEAQAQRAQMEIHIQRLSESEAALVAQTAALQAELGARALEVGQARLEAGAARDALMLAQQHAAERAQQLQDTSRACAELEQQRQCGVLAEQHMQQELRQLQERLAAMGELQNEVQRQVNRAQAAESNVEKIKEESENQKQQLSNELASLREQLADRESELAELKQIKVVPAQNGLPTANANEQHKAAELAMVESVVEALRGELDSARAAARDQRDQLDRLRDQLATYQDKNNVAIEKAQESQYNEVASVLRAACPSAAPGTRVGREWLQTFADNLKKELAKKELEKLEVEKKVVATTESPANNERLEDLLSQNEHLQGLVDKYKTIIDDTEEVLSRLQQNVSTEEQRWSQQLADKQRELEDLRQRTVLQMQNKIDSLQEELQKARGPSHNHTFADAERLTEERLMAGLSEKLNVDLSNGPLQVGIEDK